MWSQPTYTHPLNYPLSSKGTKLLTGAGCEHGNKLNYIFIISPSSEIILTWDMLFPCCILISSPTIPALFSTTTTVPFLLLCRWNICPGDRASPIRSKKTNWGNPTGQTASMEAERQSMFQVETVPTTYWMALMPLVFQVCDSQKPKSVSLYTL